MDLDETLIDWINKPEKVAAQRLGVKEPKRLDYFYKRVPIKLRAEIMSLFEDLEFMSMKNLTYDVLDKLALMKWKEKGHILTVITSRDKSLEMRKETERIIKEWFPEIDNLIIVKHGVDKIGYFKRMKPDVWIDDRPDIAHMAMEMDIRTFLIDKSYNNDPFWAELQRIQSIYQLWAKGIIK
ncbi:MAG: hypothetical protein ACFFDY_00355 [Candidatus Thorarchaeota archaeon]